MTNFQTITDELQQIIGGVDWQHARQTASSWADTGGRVGGLVGGVAGTVIGAPWGPGALLTGAGGALAGFTIGRFAGLTAGLGKGIYDSWGQDPQR